MKILFVVPYVPNLVRTRSYNFIRSLATTGNQISLATVWIDDSDKNDLTHLQELGVNVLAKHMPRWLSLLNCVTALPQKIPLQAVYSWQPELAKSVSALLMNGGRFDVIHVEHLRGSKYGLDIRKRYPSMPVLWDSVDSISYLFRQAGQLSRKRSSRFITLFELPRTEWYEGWLVKQFKQSIITSPIDRKHLIDLAGGEDGSFSVNILPNGVDLEYFSFSSFAAREADMIVLSGKMSYHANVSMALYMVESIMPLVWQKMPNATLWIVGKDPTPEVMALGRDERIKVTGTVPDIRQYIKKAALAVAPLTYGAGTQLKILEAMSCGTPVVTTKRGISALDIQPGQDVLVGDDKTQFANHIIRLLQDNTLGIQIGTAGRRYVEKMHDWKRIVGRLEAIYREMIRTEV
jgi:glycosyltransferase involved in cell wall biosynthesis